MELYDQAVANTWFPNEVQLGEDLADFERMSDDERQALTFLMSYFNPNELLVNKALAFGVYPYVNAAECHLYLAKQMWEEANHCMSFEYVLETFPIDRAGGVRLARDGAVDGRQGGVRDPLHHADDRADPRHHHRRGQAGLRPQPDRLQRDPRGDLVLLGLHGRAELPAAEPAEELRLPRRLDRPRRVVAPQVRYQPGAHRARGEPRDRHRGVRGRDQADGPRRGGDGGGLQPGPAAERHPRAERRLHQPVRPLPRGPSPRGARLRPPLRAANPAKWMAAANDTLQLVNFFESINTSYEVNAKQG